MNLALGGYIFEKDKKTRVINKHDSTIFQHYVFYLLKKILCNKKYVGK